MNTQTFDFDQSILVAELRRLGASDAAIGYALEDADDLDDWLGPHNWKPITDSVSRHYPRSWPRLPAASRANVTGPEVHPKGNYVYYWHLSGGALDGCGYIGKGKLHRLGEHPRNAIAGNGVSNFSTALHWHLNAGGTAACEILADDLTNDEACEREIAEIAQRGRLRLGTGPLLNITDGGEGTSGEASPFYKNGHVAICYEIFENNKHLCKLALIDLCLDQHIGFGTVTATYAYWRRATGHSVPRNKYKRRHQPPENWLKRKNEQHSNYVRIRRTDPAVRERERNYSRKRGQDPAYKEYQRECHLKRMQDPIYRERRREHERQRCAKKKAERELNGHKTFVQRAREILSDNLSLTRDEIITMFIDAGLKKRTSQDYYWRLARELKLTRTPAFYDRAREILTANPTLSRLELLNLFVDAGMKRSMAMGHYSRLTRERND